MLPPCSPATLRVVAGAVLAVAATALVVPLPSPAVAAPRTDTTGVAAATPAAASPPRRFFTEDFENGVGSSAVMIDQYVGAQGSRYTADPAWIDRAECNGVVMNALVPSGACQSAEGAISTFSEVLGRITGTDPQTNHSLSAWTRSRDTPARAVQLRTVGRTDVGQPGRFVTFGVDAVAGSCGQAHPLLDFALVDGTTERPVNARSIDPCSSPGSQSYTAGGFTVRGGHFVSDAAVLMQSDSLGWVMRNRQANSVGNDGAVDAVTVYDATPQLENAFDGTRPFVGETTRLTFTVRNTTELGAKPGWSFTEALPAGLVLAQDPAATTTCDAGRVDVTGGGSTVGVVGGLRSGEASCSVSVDVTSEQATTYTVDASTVRDHVGLELPGPASTTFLAEQNALAVTDTPVLTGGDEDGLADVGEQIAFRQVVTNTGTRTVSDLALTGANGTVTCQDRTLAVGASTTCTTPARAVRQADVDAGAIRDTVEAVAVSPRGAEVRASADAEQPTEQRAPAIGTTITATLAGARPEPGDPVHLVVAVVNTGNVTLHDVRGAIAGRDGLPVRCPDVLAPGEHAECTVGDHELTQEDVDAGRVSFTHHATGIDPAGEPVEASADDTVVVPRTSSIATEITAHLAASEHPVPLAGDLVASAITVTNTGTTTLIDPAATLTGHPDLAVDCPAEPLAPGATVTCSVQALVLDQPAIEHGSLDLPETATASAPDGVTVSADSTVTVGLDAASALFLAAEWTPSTTPLRVDATVASRYRVTNTSNLVVDTLAVTSTRAGATRCDAVVLAPGAATSCTAVTPSRVSDDDERAGVVAFHAQATGAVVRPDGPPVPGEDAPGAQRARTVPVASNEVRETFRIAARPEPAALAFTGATGSLAASAGAALLLLLAGVTVSVLRRRTRDR
ncbi:hypothetical protein [Curtobacterium sp. 9128]|uniref:DUF7507 domain-containing protein n=1 Tax=Curtobacterium sp. 9128 TaxID=1793722 RepID=UPI0011A019FD|nr:hypothetical protein [Curtobacterium sp. 9128]